MYSPTHLESGDCRCGVVWLEERGLMYYDDIAAYPFASALSLVRYFTRCICTALAAEVVPIQDNIQNTKRGNVFYSTKNLHDRVPVGSPE